MLKRKSFLPLLALATIGFVSCEKETEPTTNDIILPTTYEFTRNGESTVAYSGQTERINMLQALGSELAKVNTGASVDAQTLNDMFANENGAFASEGYSKDLKSKCASDQDRAYYMSLFAKTDSISKLQATASNGNAGLLLKEGSASGYLFDANGVEMRQIILKGLMGSVFYYRAIEEYLGTQINSDNNTDLVDGKNYTQMEHHYDEAFGYFGIAPDLNNADTDPKDQTRGIFWGEYLMKRHIATDGYGMPNVNFQMLQAFIAGRDAIVRKDYDRRDDAIILINKLWEEVCVNNALSYLADAKDDSDDAVRLHHLSEAIGFLIAMKGHIDGPASAALAERVIPQSSVDAALNIIGTETNLWNVSNSDIDNAINALTN